MQTIKRQTNFFSGQFWKRKRKTMESFTFKIVLICLIESVLSELNESSNILLENDSSQPTTLTIAEPCQFNRLCTCRSERQLVSAAYNSNVNQNENDRFDSRDSTRLIEVSCVQIPLSQPPVLPAVSLHSLQLIGCSHIHRLKTDALGLASVSTLTISRCGLRRLHPSSLSISRHSLSALDLSHNRLHSLPYQTFRSFTQLQWLSIRGNRLHRLSIGQLPTSATNTLRTLLASENQINQLHALGSLLALQSLDLDHNQLQSLEGRALPTSLHTLSLANNLLAQFPSTALAPLNQLKWLQLRGNHLKRLPDYWPLGTLQLDLLDLSHNMLSSLSGNSFQRHFPGSTASYRRSSDTVTLYTVDNGSANFAGGNISKSSLPAASSLSSFNNANNFNVSFPAEHQRIHVRHLQLDFNVIRQLSSNVFQALDVQRLSLSNNLLDELNQNVFTGFPSVSLQMLDLSHNQLVSVCDALQALQTLQQLQLRENRIKSLTNNCFASIAIHLHTLDLSSNPLERIPTVALQQLKKLRRLALEKCSIASLSSNDFYGGWCKHLSQLSLSNNQITALPKDAFKHCSSLRELRLSGNPLLPILTKPHEPLSVSPLIGLSTIGRKLNILQLGDVRSVKSCLLDTEPSYGATDDSNISVSPKLKVLRPKAVDEELIQALQSLKGLEVLELNHNHLSSQGWQQFDTLSSLVHLDLEGNHLFSKTSPKSEIQVFKRLRSVVLTGNKIDQLVEHSFSEMPQLAHIVLLNNQIHTLRSTALTRLPLLTNLLLAHNRLHQVQTSAFSQLPSLRTLQLQFNQLSKFSIEWFNLTDLLVRDKAFMLNDEQMNGNNGGQMIGFMPNSQIMTSSSLSSISNQGQLNANLMHSGLHLNLSHNQIMHLDSGYKTMKQWLQIQQTIFSSNHNDSTNVIETEPEFKLNVLTLDLSHNQLDNLSVNFTKIIGTQLLRLNLAYNQLILFPTFSLFVCNMLQVLNLRANLISNLEMRESLNVETEQCCSSIQELDLSHNRLESLQNFVQVFTKMNNLRILDLSHNQLNSLSEKPFPNVPLQVLNLASNSLKFEKLTNALQDDCFGVGSSLDALHIDHNPLQKLPEQLISCTQLTQLTVRNSQLTQIDKACLNISHLVILDISSNPFFTLQADSFQSLVQLETLKMSDCNLESLPELSLPELLHLYADNNSLSLIANREFAQLTKLRTLILASNRLTEVPKTQWKFLSELSELDLSDNPIEVLDSNCFSELRQLRTVDIRQLQLKYVDTRIFHGYSHLTYIKTSTYPYVRSFRLYDLLAKMSSLQRAWIDVQEEVLSHQIQWAFGSKLKELTITGKALKSILPDAFLGLYHTTDFILRITGTNITKLPDGLLRFFTNIRHVTLDLSDNQLKELDSTVLNITLKDRHIEKEMNPLQSTGGLMVQHNPLLCSCRLLWLRDWLRRWLKETRRTLLLNSELYLRNHQLAHSFTCVRPSHVPRLSPAQILHWIRLFTNVTNDSGFNEIRQNQNSFASNSNSDDQLQPILQLDEQELQCSSSSAVNSIFKRQIPSVFLISFHLISIFIFRTL